MADGKIVISIEEDLKKLKKDQAEVERILKQQQRRMNVAVEKMKLKSAERHKKLLETNEAKEYYTTKARQKDTLLHKQAAEDNVKLIEQQYSKMKELYEFSKKPGVNRGLLTIFANKKSIPLKSFDEYSQYLEYIFHREQDLSQINAKLATSESRYIQAKARITKERDKEDASLEKEFKDAQIKHNLATKELIDLKLKGKTIQENIDNQNREAEEEQARQEELDRIEAKKEQRQEDFQYGLESIKIGLQGIASHTLTAVRGVSSALVRGVLKPITNIHESIKGVNKHLKVFGRRLKYAALQGLLLRPLRQAFYSIYEGLANATKQNIVFTKSLANLKGAIWTAITPAFNALIPVLANFMNYIANIITYISALINALFKLKPASKGAASALAQSSIKGAGDKNFAKWDTVQQLKKKDTNAPVSPTFEQDFKKAEDALADLRKAVLEDDWFEVGSIMASHLNNIMTSLNTWLKETFIPFAGNFGTNLANYLNGAIQNADFGLMGENVALGLNGIIKAFDNFWTAFNGLKLGIQLADFLNNFVETFDVEQLGHTLSERFEDIHDIAIGFLENVDWQQIGEKAADFIGSIDWSVLTKKLFERIGAALGGLAAFLWGLIEDEWNKVVDWWHETAFEDGHFTLEGLLDGIIDKMSDIGSWIHDHIFQPFVDGFKRAFGIASPAKEMIPLGEYITEGMKEGSENDLSDIQFWAKDRIFNKLKGTFESVFGITGGTSAKMKSVGEAIIFGIKNGMTDSFEGLKEFVKGIINTLISMVETAVNWIIEKLNTLHWTVPDWVPLIGGKSWGFNFDPIEIPRLAQGAVVNPGHEFAAILGDNRREQEIVSPLSTMKEALMEALQESGFNRSGTVVMNIDGNTFARVTYPYNQREIARVGIKATGG